MKTGGLNLRIQRNLRWFFVSYHVKHVPNSHCFREISENPWRTSPAFSCIHVLFSHCYFIELDFTATHHPPHDTPPHHYTDETHHNTPHNHHHTATKNSTNHHTPSPPTHTTPPPHPPRPPPHLHLPPTPPQLTRNHHTPFTTPHTTEQHRQHSCQRGFRRIWNTSGIHHSTFRQP